MGRRTLTFLLLLKTENENMALEFDQEIENLSLQIKTVNVEISDTCIYPDRDAADEMNIKKKAGKSLSILDSRINY